MTVAQLESFVAVAEHGQLSRAARILHLTTPPLSRRLSTLEDELGVPLFVREARGMALTEAGERLLPQARQILTALEQAARSLKPAAPPLSRDRDALSRARDERSSACSSPAPASEDECASASPRSAPRRR
jgi:DNA-binding transcriptional LysR family regulator